MCWAGVSHCDYLWTLCLSRWIQAPLPAELLQAFHGNDWWSSWSPHRRAKRNTCMSPVGCGKAPLCSSIKLPPLYLCTAKRKTGHSYCQSQKHYTSSANPAGVLFLLTSNQKKVIRVGNNFLNCSSNLQHKGRGRITITLKFMQTNDPAIRRFSYRFRDMCWTVVH